LGQGISDGRDNSSLAGSIVAVNADVPPDRAQELVDLDRLLLGRRGARVGIGRGRRGFWA
jgi:hypothetical protein